jgi:glycerate 2-kinase
MRFFKMKQPTKPTFFLFAPDSFKESLSAKQVCVCMENAIKKVQPHAQGIHLQVADGGEGTFETLVDTTNGSIIKTIAKNPLGYDIATHYGLLGDGKTVVIEMALVNDLHLVQPNDRNPLLTSTLWYRAINRRGYCTKRGKIIVCIGGSATNDGGFGMAKALVIKFLDINNNEIGLGNAELSKLHKIDFSHTILKGKNVRIEVACQVANPLLGEKDASYTYSKQKGASLEMLPVLESNLKHANEIFEAETGLQLDKIASTCANGGLGFGLMAFAYATLLRGIYLVLKQIKIDKKYKQLILFLQAKAVLTIKHNLAKCQ